MNGLSERDGWTTHPPARSSAPSSGCPTFVGGRMWLCTVAQGTLHVGLEGAAVLTDMEQKRCPEEISPHRQKAAAM